MRSVLGSDLHAIRRSVEAVGKLSDGLLRVGPLNIGLDGIAAWVPVVGEYYSAVAAIFLLIQGLRARVPFSVLLVAAALMGGRTVITTIPLFGPIAADMLTMHKWSAKLIIKAIDKRIAEGVQPANEPLVRPAPRWAGRWSRRTPGVMAA